MDKSIEGRRGKPFRMVVEEGRIREFARAVKSSNPTYVADGPQTTSPATFLASSAFWQQPESSPWGDARLNWERILHGEQEFEDHRPLVVGDVLTGEGPIVDLYEKDTDSATMTVSAPTSRRLDRGSLKEGTACASLV